MNNYLIGKLILRYCFVAVFIWFGINQLLDPISWVAFIPNSIVKISGISASVFVFINGSFEIALAIALAFDFYAAPAALLLSLHLLAIVADVGLSPIGVRDIGLAFSLLALTFFEWDRAAIEF